MLTYNEIFPRTDQTSTMRIIFWLQLMNDDLGKYYMVQYHG